MKKPGRKSQAEGKNVSPESGGRQSQAQAIEAREFTSGLLSLLVPVVLPLAVLAIVLMASMTIAQTDADYGAKGRTDLETATTLESRSIR